MAKNKGDLPELGIMNIQEKFLDLLMSIERLLPPNEREEISKLIVKTGPGITLKLNDGSPVAIPEARDAEIFAGVLQAVKFYSRKRINSGAGTIR